MLAACVVNAKGCKESNLLLKQAKGMDKKPHPPLLAIWSLIGRLPLPARCKHAHRGGYRARRLLYTLW